jgi:hypothetical protein
VFPETELSLTVRNGDGATTRALQEAMKTASRWLADGGCRKIFSDFRDVRGRALEANLRSVGREGDEYLRWLVFFDGAHEKDCAERGAFATTRPGSRVVFLCPGFKALQGDRALAAAIVIHEELHSLGLGEDPPPSLEITNRVLSRCRLAPLTSGTTPGDKGSSGYRGGAEVPRLQRDRF